MQSHIFLEEREGENNTDEWLQDCYSRIPSDEDFEDLPGAPTALTFFDKGLTKSDIKIIAAKAIESLLAEGNPLKVAETLSAMELFIKEVKADKRYTDYVREEASKTPKGYVSASGAKIELAETGSAYDFGNCNDSLLADLEIKCTNAEIEVKKRKEFLKNVPLAGLDILTPDGEVIHIYPPSKSSNSSYKVTLSK